MEVYAVSWTNGDALAYSLKECISIAREIDRAARFRKFGSIPEAMEWIFCNPARSESARRDRYVMAHAGGSTPGTDAISTFYVIADPNGNLVEERHGTTNSSDADSDAEHVAFLEGVRALKRLKVRRAACMGSSVPVHMHATGSWTTARSAREARVIERVRESLSDGGFEAGEPTFVLVPRASNSYCTRKLDLHRHRPESKDGS